ncbi:MAG: MerR family DNA-binding transcriptional regulator [Bacteroidetes bacterium]|nr:MerR family DNA-binding transcriptional regulator [Bacteroidota bacterium]
MALGIAETCHRFGVSLRAIRHYEALGLLSPRRIDGARVYGAGELRALTLTLYILGRKIATEISLRDRSAMEFPVLIGRDTIRKHFIVNVAKTNLSFKRKNKRLKP